MTQWFGKRRIKESTIIIRILRKGSMFILYVSLQTWDTSRKLDSLIKQKLFIHTVSLPDRLRRVRDYTRKIVYDVRLQFYVYQVELCERN